MRRLRTMSTRRLWAIVAAVAALAITAGIAQAALRSDPKPAPKPLDRAAYDALRAPAVDGISARISFTNDLLPSGSLPEGTASPILAGAKGRVWLARDGRFRIELQSDAGDAQIVSDGKRLSVYDSGSNTVYRAQLPAERHQGHEPEPTLAGVRNALDRLARTWTLSGAKPTSTAGRPSYTVRITPKDDGGLLGAAELAWDASHGVPLRVAVYAQGQSSPVLELKATDISYGTVPASDLDASPPAGAKVVDLNPGVHDAQGRPTHVEGVTAVQRRLDFKLSAPSALAGLPRKSVQLVSYDGGNAALSTYGEGLGAIAVLQSKAGQNAQGPGGLRLAQVNIDGASGSEIATPLGTVVFFERAGVSYIVAGSVPPVAAENAARGLR